MGVDSRSPESLRTLPPFFSTRRASGRLLLSTAVGAVAAFAVPYPIDWHLRGVIGWDLGALALLGIVWPRISTADAVCTRQRAAAEDPGRSAVFLIAVLSSIFSLFAGLTVLRRARSLGGTESMLWSVLAVAAVGLAWTLTHTAFTLRYAHLFYRSKEPAGRGLKFPETDEPAELDFAYYAFTIGMAYQVSDVTVCDRKLRNTTLLHALLSFVYNTTILALVLNLVFGFFG